MTLQGHIVPFEVMSMRKRGWGLLAALVAVSIGLGSWYAVTNLPQGPAANVVLVWEAFKAYEGVESVDTTVTPAENGGVTTTVWVEFNTKHRFDTIVDGAEVAELLDQVGATLAPRLDKQSIDGLAVAVVWYRGFAKFVATYPVSDLIEPEFFALSSPQRQQLRAASWYPDWDVKVAVDRDGFLVTHDKEAGRHRQTLGEVPGSSTGFNRESWTHAGWQVTVAFSDENDGILPGLLSIADSLPEVPRDQGVTMSYAPVDPGQGDDGGSQPRPHALLIAGMATGELSDAEITDLVRRLNGLCVATPKKHRLLDEVWLSWTAEARSGASLFYTCGKNGLVVPTKSRHTFDAERSTAILEQGRQS